MKNLKPSIVILFVLLSSSFAAAQNDKIDSLEKAYNSAKTDSSRFNLLTTLCFKLPGTDSAKTEFYCSLLIKEVETATDPVEKADAYTAIGDYYNSKLDFTNSLGYFHKAIEIFKSLLRKASVKDARAEIAYAKCLLDYAYVYHVNGAFKTALSSYLEAESILNKYPEYDSRSGMYDRLSDIYTRLNNPQKSEYYDRKAAEIADKIVNPKLKALYYTNATYRLDSKKDFKKIRTLLEKAFSIGQKNSLQEIMWLSLNTMGDALASRGENDNAIVYYKRARHYAQKLSNKYEESNTLVAMSNAFLAQKKSKEAKEALVAALSLAKDVNAVAVEKDIYGSLASIEVSQGNFKKAYTYLKNREDAVYRTFNEEDQKQINFLNARYESAEKEAEIRRFTDREKIQSLEIQKRKSLEYILSALLLMVLITFFFIQNYYRNKKKVAEQNNQIKEQKIIQLEKEKQLAAVQFALQGEERERSRLARDLHDGLGGLLSGAKMALSSYKENFVTSGEQEDSFKHPLDLLNKSIGEMQRIAHNMMPQALVNGSIKCALSEFCGKMDNNGSLSLKFRFFGNEEKLGQNYQIAIYRIVQELVNNVIKHSGASEAFVQLIQEKDRISVTVQDNGKGFDPSDLRSFKGHGLNNIRMRVESLGGHFDINSGSNKGTEASIEFENLS